MPHTARGGSAQDSVGVSDAHITPPSSALFRWLADPGKDLPAPIRAALMAELFASPKAVLAALAAGLLLNAAALLLYPGAIFLVLLVLNVLVVALRMGVVVGCTRAMARRQATSTDLYLLTGVLSCCMLGATICVAIWIGGPPLQILAATTALGIIGPICARNYAAPRLAMLQICALDLPLLAGCALAGDLWPVALPMLAVQTPALLFGCLAVITIVGLPWARACFVIGQMAFLPFGREAIDRRELTGRDDLGTGGLGMIGNVIWFVFAGFWLAIGHIAWGLGCCLTIIGIPFGLQHFKLAGLALFPVGKTVVMKDVAMAARYGNARAAVAGYRAR